MTTPTTQREADERALAIAQEAAYPYPGECAHTSVKMRHTDQSLAFRAGWQARAAIDQRTQHAAPEAPAATIRCTRDEDVICYGASRPGELCPCPECVAARSASTILSDAEIAGIMGWRGPGAYTESTLRKIKRVIEADRAALARAPLPDQDRKIDAAFFVKEFDAAMSRTNEKDNT